MSNLRLLDTQTISSSVSAATFTDLFLDDYEIHKVVFQAEGASGAVGGNIRFVNDSGSIITSSEYDYQLYYMRGNAGFGDLEAENATSLTYLANVYDPEGGNSIFYIYNARNSNTYTFLTGSGAATDSGNGRNYKSIGVYTVSEKISGIHFVFDSNIDVGTIRTYGLRVDT